MIVNCGDDASAAAGIVDEEIAAEQIVPGELVDDPHGKAVAGIRARETVEDEEFLSRQ